MTDTTTAVTPATDQEIEAIRSQLVRWSGRLQVDTDKDGRPIYESSNHTDLAYFCGPLIARIDAERARNRALVAALEEVRDWLGGLRGVDMHIKKTIATTLAAQMEVKR